MSVWRGIRRVLRAIGRFWWNGMKIYTGETLQAEIEALERYRDFSRWHGHVRAKHETEQALRPLNRMPPL